MEITLNYDKIEVFERLECIKSGEARTLERLLKRAPFEAGLPTHGHAELELPFLLDDDGRPRDGGEFGERLYRKLVENFENLFGKTSQVRINDSGRSIIMYVTQAGEVARIYRCETYLGSGHMVETSVTDRFFLSCEEVKELCKPASQPQLPVSVTASS